MDMVINTCKKSLETYKNFVFAIVNTSKHINKDPKELINKKVNIYKPFEGFIKNNPDILDDTIKFMENIV